MRSGSQRSSSNGCASLLMAIFVSSILTCPSDACELPCLNKGICAEASAENLKPHCKCPSGYTGALCDISLVDCPAPVEPKNSNPNQPDPPMPICSSTGRLCQRAVNGWGEEFYHCECNMAKSDLSLPFAKNFCEHASTIFCTSPDRTGKQDRRGSYCTNGGQCKEETLKGRLHSGCDCPKGYSGAHCEFPSEEIKKLQSKSSASWTSSHRIRSKFVSAFTFIGIMLLFAGSGMAYLIHHGNRGRVPRRKRGTAELRARIPKKPAHSPHQSQVPMSEIEIM